MPNLRTHRAWRRVFILDASVHGMRDPGVIVRVDKDVDAEFAQVDYGVTTWSAKLKIMS